MGNFISVIKSGIELEVTDDKAINAGLKYAFSTRNGGVSVGSLSSLNLGVNRPDTRENLIENYKIFCNAIDIDYNSVVLPKQIHSDIILNVTKSDRGKRLTLVSDLPDCDGLITTDKEVALGIFYADCTPVLLYDESVHCLCLVHCGWKGTVKGLAHRAVGKMINDYLCKKENIHAIIGPCIGVCHFEVGTEVMIEFKNAGLNKCIKKGEKPDKYYIDLKEANKEYLLRAGVSEKNITVSGECTCCDTRKYFSHRACGADTGRMAVIAQLR